MDVKLRNYNDEDRNQVLSLSLNLTTKDVIKRLRLTDEKFIDIVKETNLISPTPYQGFLVAHKEEEIIGMIACTYKGFKKEKSYKTANLKEVKENLQIDEHYKYLTLEPVYNYKPKDGELYVQLLAIDEEYYRNSGVVSVIFAQLEQFAKDNNFSSLTTHVMESDVDKMNFFTDNKFVLDKYFKLPKKMHDVLGCTQSIFLIQKF